MPKPKKKTPTIPPNVILPTTRQRECLLAIARYQRRHGESPSLTTLAGELGLTKAGAQALVRKCVESGFITPRQTVLELDFTTEGKRWV